MNKKYGLLALLICSPVAIAQELPSIPNPQLLMLDKIVFQLSSKQWVSTQSALLEVHINCTLTNGDMVKARAEIMANLQKVAASEWHLLRFERSQDNSGLEKLDVQAQARVAQNDLAAVYQQAKSVSRPGAQYTIGAIEFKPSLEEVQKVKAAIREQLYQQVNDELGRINKVYPGQKYSISNLVFSEGDGMQPVAAYQAKTMNAMALSTPASAPMAVSNELILTAYVEAASNRK